MQIFHWPFKLAQEQPKRDTSTNSTNNQIIYQEAGGKDIVLYKHSGSHRGSERAKKGKNFGARNFRAFAFLCKKDGATACFYCTLNLRRINNLNRRQHNMMKKEDIDHKGQGIISTNNTNKMESTSHVRNKVLPIMTDTTLSPSSTTSNDQCGSAEKIDKIKGDKMKAISRMKELLRWAATAKSEKKEKFIGRKFLRFRNRATTKAIGDEEEDMSNESPKISFRWEVESCSTTSSVCSGLSMASSSKIDVTLNMVSLNSTPLHHRKGNWITTDSEFVVLEL